MKRRNYNQPVRLRTRKAARLAGVKIIAAQPTPRFLMPRELPLLIAIHYRMHDEQFTMAGARDARLPMPIPVTNERTAT